MIISMGIWNFGIEWNFNCMDFEMDFFSCQQQQDQPKTATKRKLTVTMKIMIRPKQVKKKCLVSIYYVYDDYKPYLNDYFTVCFLFLFKVNPRKTPCNWL